MRKNYEPSKGICSDSFGVILPTPVSLKTNQRFVKVRLVPGRHTPLAPSSISFSIIMFGQNICFEFPCLRGYSAEFNVIITLLCHLVKLGCVNKYTNIKCIFFYSILIKMLIAFIPVTFYYYCLLLTKNHIVKYQNTKILNNSRFMNFITKAHDPQLNHSFVVMLYYLWRLSRRVEYHIVWNEEQQPIQIV